MPSISQLRKRAEVELGVPRTLYAYQWEGIAFLHQSRSALLADEMGLGKTVQAIIALSLLLNEPTGVNRVLIVAPASLTTNWMFELEQWAPLVTAWRIQGAVRDRESFYLLPVPVLVGSYEQIRHDGLDRIPANTFDLVILDEAQRIKNRNSATALACRLLHPAWSWALTATPLENDRSDVASILSFLDPGTGIHDSTMQLKRRLQSIMLRRRKCDVRADLPAVILQDMKVELYVEQRKEYDDLWVNRMATVEAEVSGRDFGAMLLGLITRLKLICNAVGEVSSKIDALETIVEGIDGSSRVLVFSQFVKTLRKVSERLSLPHDLLIGSMTPAERRQSIERFKHGPAPRILLVSLRAGGVGLNLGEATHVIIFDRWWNPAVESQAIYRAHRFSRKDPLHVIRFLVTDSIEERVAAILERKKNLFSETIGATDMDARLTKTEMMDILLGHGRQGEVSDGEDH